MTEFMRIVARGIKCDAVGCGYEDPTADLSEAAEWLNKPCPLCGAALLTQADLDLILRLQAGAAAMNAALADSLPPEMLAGLGDDLEFSVAWPVAKLEMHGDGSLTIRLPPAPPSDKSEA